MIPCDVLPSTQQTQILVVYKDYEKNPRFLFVWSFTFWLQ